MPDWQPSAPLMNLAKRAEILAIIRQYFAQQQVLEVDTPVLSHCAVSDPFIDSLEVAYRAEPQAPSTLCYLQTSPEYAMKRLLAAGSGPIYQLGKVFRNGESGRRHNPEFTLLEWYRPGMDEQQLMADVEALLNLVMGWGTIRRISYHELFQHALGLDLEQADEAELAACARGQVDLAGPDLDRDGWLNLLMSHCIEPTLQAPTFVTDYPASQAALARLKTDSAGRLVAARFELFCAGMELANGYHELTDASEQQRRLLADQAERAALGLPQRPLDHRLVSALRAGLPDCAGVALGVDRLVMLALGCERIDQVIPFSFANA